MSQTKVFNKLRFILSCDQMCHVAALVCMVSSVAFSALQSASALAAKPDIKEVFSASTSANAEAKTSTIAIDNFAFTPATLEITAGTTVTWVNHDDMPHTVVSDAKPHAFASPALDTDDHYAYLFSKPGTYSYFCSMHPRMSGTIIVR